jgi:hypothetical protein
MAIDEQLRQDGRLFALTCACVGFGQGTRASTVDAGSTHNLSRINTAITSEIRVQDLGYLSICGGGTGPGKPKSRPEFGLDLDRQLLDGLGFEQRHPELPRTQSEQSQDVSEEPEDSVCVRHRA